MNKNIENYKKAIDNIQANDDLINKTINKANEKKPNKKEIWLINDRINKAGDNGEFFFRYLKNKNPEDIINTETIIHW